MHTGRERERDPDVIADQFAYLEKSIKALRDSGVKPEQIVLDPGYGFANAPKPIVEKWQRLLKAYLSGRQSLRRVFLLIDARHGAKDVDEEIMQLLGRSAVTFQVILTKCDKPRKEELDKSLQKTIEVLQKHPAAFPEVIMTSSEKGDGIETLRSVIATMV